MPETASQTHDRLCEVIAASDFAALSEPHAWQKVEHLSTLPSASLAAVGDGSVWYVLAPVAHGTVGSYRILVFHFAEGSNASGFVAWLAAVFKKEAATGAMVVCGYDVRATEALWQTSLGLFDYWGCPWDRGDDVIALVERLRGKRR